MILTLVIISWLTFVGLFKCTPLHLLLPTNEISQFMFIFVVLLNGRIIKKNYSNKIIVEFLISSFFSLTNDNQWEINYETKMKKIFIWMHKIVLLIIVVMLWYVLHFKYFFFKFLTLINVLNILVSHILSIFIPNKCMYRLIKDKK